MLSDIEKIQCIMDAMQQSIGTMQASIMTYNRCLMERNRNEAAIRSSLDKIKQDMETMKCRILALQVIFEELLGKPPKVWDTFDNLKTSFLSLQSGFNLMYEGNSCHQFNSLGIKIGIDMIQDYFETIKYDVARFQRTCV